jgi:hypothetical protein
VTATGKLMRPVDSAMEKTVNKLLGRR